MRKKDMQSACGEREHGEDADRTLRRMSCETFWSCEKGLEGKGA